MHYPVPLAINSWTNRFDSGSLKVINEAYWIFQKGFVITSFGFGGAESKVCGKTELNNKLFFSNFVESSQRNKICQGCPEILFDVYKNDNLPINLIDIPSQTDTSLVEKILENSNMLIIHSLEDPEKTKEYVQGLSYKVPIIIIYRDTTSSFSNTKIFKKNLSEKMKLENLASIIEIEVEDLSCDDKSNEIEFISLKINEFIISIYKKTSDQDLWRFSDFFSHSSKTFNNLLEKIEANNTQLIQITPIFANFSQIDQDDKDYDRKEQEKSSVLKSLSNRNWLAPEINELSEFLIEFNSSSKELSLDNTKLFLEKLQEHIEDDEKSED